MKQLAMALLAEGKTDHQFIRIVAQRTAERVLNLNCPVTTEVLDPIIFEESGGKQADRILGVAHSAFGFHLILIHADADSRTSESAWSDRIEPGFQLIHDAKKKGEKVCEQVVPVIPVQMTEAWMLADPEALIETIGFNGLPAELGLPPRPRLVEGIADPKSSLKEVISTAVSTRPRRRRRELSISQLYEPLAGRIELEFLAQVPAYQRFQSDLKRTLSELSFF